MEEVSSGTLDERNPLIQVAMPSAGYLSVCIGVYDTEGRYHREEIQLVQTVDLSFTYDDGKPLKAGDILEIKYKISNGFAFDEGDIIGWINPEAWDIVYPDAAYYDIGYGLYDTEGSIFITVPITLCESFALRFTLVDQAGNSEIRDFDIPPHIVK